MKQTAVIFENIFLILLLVISVVLCSSPVSTILGDPETNITEKITNTNTTLSSEDDQIIIRKEIEVVSSENVIYQNGSFMYSYFLDNGNKDSIEGYLKTVDNEQIYSIKGEYLFVVPNGDSYIVNFIADENGFQVITFQKQAPFVATVNPKAIASILG